MIAKGDPKAALRALPNSNPLPTNCLQPKAWAELLLGKTQIALQTANEALTQEPSWIDHSILAGKAHYFSALSPAYRPEQIVSPDPIPPSMYRDDLSASQHLQLANDYFTAILNRRIPDHERPMLLLWLLAINALRGEHHDEAAVLLESLLLKDPKNNIAILWGIGYGLDFDRDKVRKACQINLASEDRSAADVISLLLVGAIPENEKIAFLESHHSLFNQEGQTPIYEHWLTRLRREASTDTGDALGDTDVDDIDSAIRFARESGDWEPIGALIDEKQDDSMVLMMCTEALAMHDQWPLVAKNTQRLTEEIGTAIGFRLAATALINVDDDRRCLKVIEEWASRLSEEDRLPIEFWRLRSAALTRLGDVSGAMETTATLLRKSDAEDDLGRAIDMHLRFGDVRAAVPFIAHLADKDQLSVADALNYSRVVQHDDENLAVKLLDGAATKGAPPEQTATAYEIAERLSRIDLSRQFYDSMRLAANTPGTGVHAVTPNEVFALFRQRQQQSVDVNEQFIRGQIPLSTACRATNQNLVLRFEAAFSAKSLSLWSDPLPVFHGSRADPMQGLPDIKAWKLCLDITALLVLDEIELLPLLIETVEELRVPFELPGALLEMADEIAVRQPARIEILEAILAAADGGVFESNTNLGSLNEESHVIHVQVTDGRSTQDENAIGLLDLVRLAVERGVLDEEEARRIINADELGIPSDFAMTLPPELTLVFDGSSIETATRLLGVKRLSALATCVVEVGYLSQARDESDHAKLCRRATSRVTALRNYLLDGLKTGKVTLLAQLAPGAGRDDEIKSAFDATLFRLLSQPASDNLVLGFDDRLINRHPSTDHNPIVCTLDIIHHLGESGALSEEGRVQRIEQLQAANLFFATIAKEDLFYLLSLSRTKDGVLVETPRLRDFARYVARCRALETWLDQNPAAGTPSEMPFDMLKFRLVDRTVERIWDDPEPDRETVEARANWVWNSFYVPVSETLPVFNRTDESLRTLVAIQLSSLLTSAMTTFMTNPRDNAKEWMGWQIDWVWNTCIAPYVEGTPGLLSVVARLIRYYFSKIDDDAIETADEDEKKKVGQTARVFVRRFLVALPDPLKSEILGDRAFAAGIGIQRVLTTHSGDVSADNQAVRTSMVRATVTGKPQILQTSGGETTVELTQRGSLARSALVTFSGAMSMVLEEPLLALLTGDRLELLRTFSATDKLLDLPTEYLNNLIKECESLSDLAWFERLDAIRGESASGHYQHLATLMGEEEPMDGTAFDAPMIPSLLRMLRLPLRSRKRASFLVDFAAESLIGQYGPKLALERLGGLPVELAPRFVDAFESLLDDRPRATKSWLLSDDGSVTLRLHKLAIASALSARKKFGMKSIRKALRRLLSDWNTHAELLVRLVNATSISPLACIIHEHFA